MSPYAVSVLMWLEPAAAADSSLGTALAWIAAADSAATRSFRCFLFLTILRKFIVVRSIDVNAAIQQEKYKIPAATPILALKVMNATATPHNINRGIETTKCRMGPKRYMGIMSNEMIPLHSPR
jgi:hypothetical protein